MTDLNLTGLKNGPKVWDALLSIVGAYWLPVVAGGALRDHILGVDPKDIDIVVPALFEDDFTSIIESLNSATCEGTIIYPSDATGSEYEASAPLDLVGVWEGEIIGYPVNIIGRKSLRDGPLRLVETFDFDVLKLWYANGDIEATPAATRDLHQRRATLAHDRTYDQSLRRFARFNERNPGKLTLRDPFGRTRMANGGLVHP